MAYDSDGFWQEDEDPYKYADYTNPDGSEHKYEAPKEPEWDPKWGAPVTSGPGSAGQPGVAFYNGGPGQDVLNNLNSQGIPWQNVAAPKQTTAPPTTTTTPPPPNTNGNPGPSNQPNPGYKPPPLQPSPFVTPNGQIPPGMPYSPNPHAVALQNQAMEKALTTPAYTQTANPLLDQMQTSVMQQLLGNVNNPLFGPEYTNMLNEQQKEIQLARQGQVVHDMQQRAASRGTTAGGGLQAGIRRAQDDTTKNILQAHRDTSIQTQQANRDAQMGAMALADQVGQGAWSRDYQGQIANRGSLLDALGMSDTIYGGREDRGLNVSRLMEMIRQYDQDLLNRQSEFGSRLGFDYSTLNSGNDNAWLAYLARIAGK